MLLPSKNKGSALLTALFIMTLVAIVATAMSSRLQVDIYRTQLIVERDKLYLASEAVMFWAFNELNNKKNKFTKLNAGGMVAQYPKNIKNIYQGVKISGGVYDLQARLNLNNLVEKKSFVLFINLINKIYPKANDNEKINLVLALRDWLGPYDLSKGKDVYTSYYLNQKPAYYPSHQLMASSSEFRLIKDVDAAMYQSIQPFITVLPETTAININTASKQVLMSLGDGLSEGQAKELIKARKENGIKKIKDINPLLQKLNIPGEQITLTSQYYLSVAYANSEHLHLISYVLLKRSQNNDGKITISVIRQSLNNF